MKKVVTWLREKFNGSLLFALFVLALLMAALWIHPIRAHDHSRPEMNSWMQTLHAKNNTWCCNGDDNDVIDDWEAAGDRYRVKFRGAWYDVPDGAIVDGPNKAKDAILWMNKFGWWGAVSVRCFMPGAMT